MYNEYYIDVPEHINNPLTDTSMSNDSTTSIYPVNNSPSPIINANNSNSNLTTNFNFPTIHYNINSQRFLTESFWRVYNKFQCKILNDYPDTPCVYCGRLLYKGKATWIAYDSSQSYPIERVDQINVYDLYGTLRRQIVKIPSCSSCAKPRSRFQFPMLARIPDEIEAVPLHRRKFLSPVHLHCSLGRNSDSNSYSEYRSIVGTMGYSINIRALALYSGIIGAYLQPLNPNYVPNEDIFDDVLLQAASWLSNNNPYLHNYTSIIHQRSNTGIMGPFPTATHIPNDDTAPPVNQRDIIVPIMDLPSEVHNEDFHYSRLMVGFINNNNNNKLPISTYDPNLEPLLFPHLFPDGKGHFHDIREHAQSSESRLETLGKYAKHMILLNDPRFRLDHYWPSYIYLQIEKLRHHQNTQRILHKKNMDELHRLPIPSELIQQSNYSRARHINEDLTIPIPTFIRTGDSYFHEKELHLNSMLQKLGLPTIFITLSMAESRWIELHNILQRTDNNDTIPTNRPLHCALHFMHRFRSLKKEVWKNEKISGWGTITDFFDRVEFQNRGAAHTHGCYWTTKSIEYMIQNDIIRSDLPDPEQEPELYQKVLTYQIHRCDSFKCGGPAPPGEQCKKGFPRQFSDTTHVDQNSCRYIYKCTRPIDQWVVPYHPETLLIWNAHMNAQYITSKGFAKYVTKYIAKSEPSHIFNITDNDKFREHIIARRLGAMEAMFLILGEPICNSSIQVKYLVTDPPNSRSKAVLPIRLIIDDEDPYFKDPIEKYMSRPINEIFDQVTYPEYFEKYIIQNNRPTNTRRNIYQDQLGNYVLKRVKPIIVRYRFLKVTDGELYFYQLLLKTIPARSEGELKGNYSTYRDRYTSMFPDIVQEIQQNTQNRTVQIREIMNSRYSEVLDRLLSNLESIIPENITHILRNQLDSLKILPPILPEDITHQLPPDQYYVLSTLRCYLGRRDTRKWPYFFITGSAGTGKSYIIHLLINSFKSNRSKYLLMAPTGIAAQNVGGSTIHSSLRIGSTQTSFHSLALYDNEFRNKLKAIDTIIIEEISMVSSQLFEFISNMLATIHNNTLAFGGINVIVVGDLAQLPPVSGSQVFKSSVWKLFYPLFLRQPHRQQEQSEYFDILQNIRLGNLTDEIWEKLQRKHETFDPNKPIDILLNTTNIVGYRETADKINRLICNTLPVTEEKFMISNAIDTINGEQWNTNLSERAFKSKTNLPASVRLQQGAKVMYLNNSKSNLNIYNGTIGVITDVNTESNLVRVSFSVPGGIIDIEVKPDFNYFTINGNHASRHQFPIQNCYALTVHKTQGLTLSYITVSLDDQIFSAGQAYTALSRCPDWDHVQIAALDRAAFKTDPDVIQEYNRLEVLAASPLPI